MTHFHALARRRALAVALLAALALAAAEARARQTTAPPAPGPNLTVRYEIGMSRPTTRLFEVALVLENVSAPEVEIQFPVWVPGAYTVVDPARNVQEFRAATAAGQPLVARKTQPNAWRVETRGATALRADFKVYADNIAVPGAHLDDTHAFFNGPLVFPYVVGAKERPATVAVKRPPRWTVISTGLDPVPGRADTFAAPDYDTLVDAPFEIGTHDVMTFDHQGVRYEIAVYGNHNYDPQRFRAEVESIVRSQVAMMCGAPFRRYVFIYHMLPDGRSGLEHLNSTVINRRKYAGNTDEGWDSLRGVTSHEFFHLWNVKRLRPEVLGPFDYARQVPTRDLYVSEGMTSYFGDLHLRRAGLWSNERYYKKLADEIKTLQSKPARRFLTAEESSLNTWLRADDPENANFSYYNKGELLGLLLDLEIRQRTNNSKSLDDVFRQLLSEFGLPKRGWQPGGFQKAVESVAGSDFSDFFRRYVAGTDELPYERALAYAGLRLERKEAKEVDPGFTFKGDDEQGPVGLAVKSVGAESPAYNVLAIDDLLLAVAGERVTKETFPLQLARFREGERVPVTVFRGDRLLELSWTMRARPAASYLITEDPNATPAQRALRESWLKGESRCR
ncbi:MAG TPA: hypothetical protein VER08_02210 [Pyrinomonadaceae bacterium]|nr:hypothetical protein [Pyrinomonadaceae bacterium]